MKINNWTRALLATGVVGMGAIAQAEEAPASQVLTAVSGTQLSGYISTTASWGPNILSTATSSAATSFAPTLDGFDLDVIDITLSKPLDEGEWSSGYTVELWAGPNATGLGNQVGGAGIAIKQANIQLNAPIGNGLVLTMGVFDTIIGYEVANNPDNPNYTRSYGFTTEPFQHLGLLASYQLCEEASLSVGIADNTSTVLNTRNGNNSSKTYMAALNVTAPESFGPLAGTSLTAGVVDGDPAGTAGGVADETHIYVGATIPTHVEGLTLGVAWDHVNLDGAVDTDAIAAYIGYGVSDKASLNLRVDYLNANANAIAIGTEFFSTTLTLDYALWENVLTRAEWRFDKDLEATTFSGGSRDTSHLFALNVVYAF